MEEGHSRYQSDHSSSGPKQLKPLAISVRGVCISNVEMSFRCGSNTVNIRLSSPMNQASPIGLDGFGNCERILCRAVRSIPRPGIQRYSSIFAYFVPGLGDGTFSTP